MIIYMSYADHAKVSQFDPAAGGVAQENILWFKVSVDKTKGVEMGESTTQLGHHPLTAVLLHTNLRMTVDGRTMDREGCESKSHD